MKFISILLTLSMLIASLGCIGVSAEHAEGLPFEDVKEGAWYYDAISYCYTNELLSGMSRTEFGTGSYVTREMFVKALANFAQIDEDAYKDAETPFEDVKQGAWYYAAIEWARQNSIVNGMSNTRFGVGEKLTREQMSRLLCEYAQYMGKDISEKADYEDFTDVDKISDWASEGMNYAIAKSFIVGSDGELNPRDNTTRAQLAVVLKKFHYFYSRRVVIWGDSLTMGVIDSNTNLVDRPYPQTVENILGIETLNYGVGGDQSEQIAMRQGSIDVWAVSNTLNSDLVIPEACDPVKLAIEYFDVGSDALSTVPYFGANGMRGVNPVVIAGVEGQLEYDSSVDAYYFTRSTAGEAVVVNETNNRISTFAERDKKDTDINVLYIGNNNGYQPYESVFYDNLKPVHDKMIEFSGSDDYVIVGFTCPSSYLPGLFVLNDIMREVYADRFVDARATLTDADYIVSRGVELDENDLQMISKGEVPLAMIHKEDGAKLHGSQLYYDIIGELVAERIIQLGYLD